MRIRPCLSWFTGPRPRWLARELLAPLSVYGILTWILSGDLARNPGQVVGRQFDGLRPEDYLGTLWFYRHVHDSLVQGAPLLRPTSVCAPTGTSLGDNFPNHVDALLAFPFVHLLPFPQGVNLFFAAIPVLSSLAAFFALRAFAAPAIALPVAALYGFNAYTYGEMAAGRPTMALTLVVPLLVGTWARALHSPRWLPALAWSGLAAASATLAVYYHAVYAFLCALFGALLAAGRVLVPAPNVSRLRPAVLGLAVLGVTCFLSGTYLYQVTALQRRLPTPTADLVRPPTTDTFLPPWDPGLWRYLAGLARFEMDRSRRPQPVEQQRHPLDDTVMARMAEQSLPVSYPWKADRPLTDPSLVLHPGFLAPLVAALALLSGRRAWIWLGVTLLLYSLTLGPWACVAVRPRVEPLLVEGARIRLPDWFLYRAFPSTLIFVKPLRLFPGFLLTLLVTLGVSLGDRGALARLPLPSRFRPWVAPGLAVALAVASLVPLGLAIRTAGITRPYAPDPFHLQMAQDPPDYSIIELPAGLGHVTAGFQLIHGKRRSESHHDEISTLQAGRPPASDCYRLPLLRALWDLGRSDQDPIREGMLEEAGQEGFRYVVVYPRAYEVLKAQGVSLDLNVVREVLERHLGPPVARTPLLEAWRIGAP